MKVIAIIQARLGSSRLPGKVLADLCGQPLIYRVAERVLKIPGLDGVVVAAPYGEHQIAKAVAPLDVHVVFGPHLNVLTRFLLATHQMNGADVILRFTGDCWAICPEVSSKMLTAFTLAHGYGSTDGVDYLHNLSPDSGYPDGMDTEIFSYQMLVRAYKEATDDYDKEHVGTYMKRHGKVIMLKSEGGDYGRVKLSVDSIEDLERARRLTAMLPEHWTFADLRLALDAEDSVQDNKTYIDTNT